MTFKQAREALAISESITGDNLFGYYQAAYYQEASLKAVIIMQLCDMLGPDTDVYTRMFISTRRAIRDIILDIQHRVFFPAAIKDSEWLSPAWYSDKWQILDLYGVAAAVRRPE